MTAVQYRKMLNEKKERGEATASELQSVHVRFERKQYDTKTGKKLSNPKIDCFGIKEWGITPTDGVRDYLTRAGYNVEVLFDPRVDYTKKVEEPADAINPDDTEAEVSTEEVENTESAEAEEPKRRGRKMNK